MQGYESIATSTGMNTSKRIFQVILIFSIVIDAVFLWVHTKPELFYVLGAIAILKTIMLVLIEHNNKPIHRIFQAAILLFIIGVAWL